MSATGLDVSGKVIVLEELQQDLIDGGIPLPHGLSIIGPDTAFDPANPPTLPGRFDPPPPCIAGAKLYTYDDQGALADLPPAAGAIVNAHVPDPPPDPLAAIRAVPLGSTTDELRDAIVDYLAAIR